MVHFEFDSQIPEMWAVLTHPLQIRLIASVLTQKSYRTEPHQTLPHSLEQSESFA